MFKKIIGTMALIGVIAVLVFGAINRTQAKTENTSSAAVQQGYGNTGNRAYATSDQAADAHVQGQGNYAGNGQVANGTQGGGGGQNSLAANTAQGELSAEEAAALLYMREEEKLAHDVYATLYTQWGLSIFQNISQSEQTHTDSVKALIERYGLTDPASETAGIFSDPTLQALYTELVARGSESLAEAIKVGAAIEEIDILDLQTDLAQIDNADIQRVFNNLLKGSYNHLRSFTSTLSAQTGETYQPQYLSAEAYQAALNESMGRGGNSSSLGNGQGSNSAGNAQGGSSAGNSQGGFRGGNGQGGNGGNRP